MPGLAVTAVGAPGVVRGVTAAEAADADPLPATFLAFTVNVYGAPLVRPDTVQDKPAVVQELLPGDAVAV